MEIILLEERNILEYIHDSIYNIRIYGREIKNAKYHHNTTYKDAPSICKYGILSLVDLNKQGIRRDPKELLRVMEDNESHVNGNDCVSLAVVGLTDIYPNEDEYNPFLPNLVDFLVCSDIRTRRSSIHYGNEFLSSGSIKKEKIKSVDIRLLKLLNLDPKYLDTLTVLEQYNYLREIALEIKEGCIEMPLREMSGSNIFELDIEKLATQPKILLKELAAIS